MSDTLLAVLKKAQRAFEEIRLILIKHLDEPESSAFWLAVEGRVLCDVAIWDEDAEREHERAAWSCSKCGDSAPKRFRVFGKCYICAYQYSLMRRDRKIELLEREVSMLEENLKTLGADTNRLDWLEKQVRLSRSGVSFDKVPSVDDERGGYRFMRFHYIGDPAGTLRAAIDEAVAVRKGV